MFQIKSEVADFQQYGMCHQQSLRSVCPYAQSDQSLCLSLEYSMSVKLLTEQHLEFLSLTLKAPMATKVVCFSHLLKCLRSLYGKQCGPRPDCSYWSSLIWVHNVSFHTKSVRNARQLFVADHFSRRHFQMHFFLDALRVKRRLHRLV